MSSFGIAAGGSFFVAASPVEGFIQHNEWLD